MPPQISYNRKLLSTTYAINNFKGVVKSLVTLSATAILKHNNMTGGSSPLSSINPPGWGTGECPAHHNRGHLIGNKIGGPGNNAMNLVTLVSLKCCSKFGGKAVESFPAKG